MTNTMLLLTLLALILGYTMGGTLLLHVPDPIETFLLQQACPHEPWSNRTCTTWKLTGRILPGDAIKY